MSLFLTLEKLQKKHVLINGRAIKAFPSPSSLMAVGIFLGKKKFLKKKFLDVRPSPLPS